MTRNRTKVRLFGLLLCLIGTAVMSGYAQKDPHKATTPKLPKPGAQAPTPAAPPVYSVTSQDGVTTEKAIAVDPDAYLKLCVSEGRVRINGWERDEVRVFVKDGSKFVIKPLEKSHSTGKPNSLWIANMWNAEGRRRRTSECITGESIEIDVPTRASLTVSGHATQTVVDSVKKIVIKSAEGSVALRNIAGGILANVYQGDLTVENSGGAISLETTTGNIVAYEVTPGQIGDLFKAKTNSGAISLQKVEHRQIESSSISGSQLFSGKFLPGGLYNFKTSNGSIRLLLPSESSAMLEALYGFGSFDCELPLKFLREDDTPAGKNIVARMGNGDATVKLITTSGSIGIRKQRKEQ